jgi:thioredoxin-dependent peroxiredoxin
MMNLGIGDKAPEFTLVSDQNELIALKNFRGKKVVLYFYPKDETPGCTKEACDFRDQVQAFTKQNMVIMGVSKDKPKSHQKFKEKYQLPFTLLADVNGDVCQAYGVLNKKSLFGKTFLGIQRSTFLIDEEGRISNIWRKVTVNGHVQAVLEALASS